MSRPGESTSGDPAPSGPDDEQQLRRARAGRAVHGALAAVLCLEALVALLLPRALAFSDGGLGVTRTLLLVALAVVLIGAAGLVRRPWGIGLGTLLQVALLLTGIWLLVMVVVGLVFAAVWVRLLMLRHELLGTPGGVRMLLG